MCSWMGFNISGYKSIFRFWYCSYSGGLDPIYWQFFSEKNKNIKMLSIIVARCQNCNIGRYRDIVGYLKACSPMPLYAYYQSWLYDHGLLLWTNDSFHFLWSVVNMNRDQWNLKVLSRQLFQSKTIRGLVSIWRQIYYQFGVRIFHWFAKFSVKLCM